MRRYWRRRRARSVHFPIKQLSNVANRNADNEKNEGGSSLPGGPSAGGGRGRLIIWVIAGTLLALWAYSYWGMGASGGDQISYSEFRSQVQNENVERVVVQGDRVRGELKSTASRTQDGSTVEYTNFVTYIPSFGDDQLMERLPNGYDQDVKERGSSLSRGQRQLLAFVRALLYDPDVMVLDEATSSVDTETEALIQRALERVTEGRTTLAIAHRLSTIQDADTILVMHKGEIRERGTHQELLSMDGLYHKLYDLQYADQAAPRGDGARADQHVQA